MIIKDMGCVIRDVPAVMEIRVSPESEAPDAKGSVSLVFLDGSIDVLSAEGARDLASALAYAADAAADIK